MCMLLHPLSHYLKGCIAKIAWLHLLFDYIYIQ